MATKQTKHDPEEEADKSATENLQATREEQGEAGDTEPEAPAPIRKHSPRGAVVGGGDTDPVYLSRAEYKSRRTRKSLTVHHLQRRLNELGYTDAYSDPDGYYGDLTKRSVEQYQRDNNLEPRSVEDSPLPLGYMDITTLRHIFKDDENVTVKF